MDFLSYIAENTYVLIPVLYFVGHVLKGYEGLADKHIPVILTIVSTAFCMGLNGMSVDSVIQGVLVAGATVLGNQLVKQYNEKGGV